MPIDIATGALVLDFDDFSVNGRIGIVWDRRYNTAFIGRPASPLGRGWTNRYFASLTQKEGGFEFLTPTGVAEVISDPEGSVQEGGRAVNFGAFLEVFREGRDYIVQNWDIDTGEVWRYRFAPSVAGQAWPLTSIEDSTGQAVELVRNDAGSLGAITRRIEQRSLLLTYSASGFIESVTFRASSSEQYVVARYEYDPDGNLTAAYNAADQADRYEYDSNGRITRQIVKDGGVFSYQYDTKGRCVRSVGLDGYDEKRLHFLDASRITEVTNSYDSTFRYQYLPSGQIVQQIDPLGGERNTDYDQYGRVIAATDATGASTKYAYDEYGNRSAVTDALGNTSSFAYNEHHRPLSMTDPAGNTWQRLYDHANQLVSAIDPLNHRWQIRYDSEGNVSEIENPLGALKQQQYSQGLLTGVTDWMGNVTRFRFDAFCRVIQRIGPLGETTHLTYDLSGNPVQVRLPDGAVLHATYDNAGNLTSFTDANGYTKRFRFGSCQRLLERIDPLGGTVSYLWGTEPGRLEGVVNEKGEVYRFFRDLAGHVTREQPFDGIERSFINDAEGYVLAYTNANGETVGIGRDNLHRAVSVTLPEGGAANFVFDSNGNLVTAANENLSVVFERDPLGRIVREVQGEQWVASRYNAVDSLVGTTTSLGHAVDYEVDANGYARQLTTAEGRVIAFQRNPYGQETVRQMPGSVVLEQLYNNVGRLIEQHVLPDRLNLSDGYGAALPGRAELISRRYTYDRNSQLIRIVDGNWGRIICAYDPAERLLEVLRESGQSEFFSYDPCRNITRSRTDGTEHKEETSEYGPGNRLLRKGGTSYRYDVEGRRVEKIENAGCPESRVWHYTWDSLDRLRAVRRPDGEIWRYKYDALGRRIAKASGNERREFIWNRDKVAHESDGVRSISAWIFDTRTFVPVATVQRGQLYSIINDQLGTPRELIDENGVIAFSFTSTAWGIGLPAKPQVFRPPECPLRFQGQWHDDETGLAYNRYRYYDAETGSFLSQDPVRLVGGINLYAYVRNPAGWVDPLGLTAAPATLPNEAGIYVVQNGNQSYVGQAGMGSGGGTFQQGMNDRLSSSSDPGQALLGPGARVQFTRVDLGTATDVSERNNILRYYEAREYDREVAAGQTMLNKNRPQSASKTEGAEELIDEHGASASRRRTTCK